MQAALSPNKMVGLQFLRLATGSRLIIYLQIIVVFWASTADKGPKTDTEYWRCNFNDDSTTDSRLIYQSYARKLWASHGDFRFGEERRESEHNELRSVHNKLRRFAIAILYQLYCKLVIASLTLTNFTIDRSIDRTISDNLCSTTASAAAAAALFTDTRC